MTRTAPMKKVKKKSSKSRQIFRRLGRNKSAMVGLALLAILFLMAIFADVIADYQTVTAMDIGNRLQPPSAEHIFGTDSYGRDVFARIAHGSRVSLLIGFAAVTLALVTGGTIGALAGYYGGMFDNIVMRVMDMIMAIPSTIFALAVVAALGPGLVNLMLAIAIADIANYARIVRSSAITCRNADYIESARASGAGTPVVLLRHIVPNIMGPIIVQCTLGIAAAILNASGLSFIGLGLQPPQPEWGAMLSEAKQFIRQAPYLIIIPGAFIASSVLSLNLLGDGLRDALDPRLKD